MKIKQTIGAPLLETFLYIGVQRRSARRIDKLHGIDYVVLRDPGLIMMAGRSTVSNNASSILQQKFQGAIQDQLLLVSLLELLLASLGGFMRGLVVVALTLTAASSLVDLLVEHILALISGCLVGFLRAVLVSDWVRAEQFDDVAIADLRAQS